MPPTSHHAYLESTGISTVLAEAVAGILRERPADPIEALAERLKAHKHKSPSSSPLDDEEAKRTRSRLSSTRAPSSSQRSSTV